MNQTNDNNIKQTKVTGAPRLKKGVDIIPKLIQSPLYIFMVLVFSIFITHWTTMFVMYYFIPHLSSRVEEIISAVLMILMIFPVLYFFSFRPLLESIAKNKRAEQELRRNYDIQTVISTLLRLSLEDIPLEEFFEQSLDQILSIPWLSFESRGCIFLVEDDPEVLVMKAQRGLEKQLKRACARLPFGTCHCGRAASTQEIQFADCLDDGHDIRYSGIAQHGHYCVPVLSGEKMLGILNIYLRAGHNRNRNEEEFLTTVSVTLASIIVRRQAEIYLKQSQQNYESLVSEIEGIVWEADAKTFQFLFVSKQAERFLGYPVSNWLREPTFWKDHIHPNDQEWVVSFCRNATAEKRNHEFEYRMIAIDGRTVWLRDIVTVVIENGQPVKLRGVMIDITERKLAEEEVAKLSNVVHQAEDVIFITDLNGIIEFVNPAFEKISGYSAEDAIGKTPRILKSGKTSPEYYKQFWDTILSGRSMHAEVINKRKNGEIWFYDQTIVPVRDSQGSMINFISTGRDVTDRKQAEEEIRKLNKELEQRVRERTAELEAANQELESFSYSVSHDLRAPLRTMDGFSQIVLEDYRDRLDAQGKDYLQRVRKGARHMAELIDDLLQLSRVTRSKMKRELVDLSAMAKEVAAEVEKTQPEREGEFIIADGLVTKGDSPLLRLVMENLIGNAWKFTSPLPRARIEFGVTQVNDESVYFVRDNGVGFDMAYADKLFTPFQRLHGETEFEGTGIGLASVKRIILRHGGRVWAESKEGSGATFYFTLQSYKEK